MIPIDKIAQLIPYQDMFTASQINRSYEVRKSFYYQTNKETKTPNVLLTGKPRLYSVLQNREDGVYFYCRRGWRHVQHITDTFWNRWCKEYLLLMMLIFGELCKCQFLTSVIQCNLCNRTSSLGQVILLRFIPV